MLLINKIDDGLWALPGGAMDLGESVRDAVREIEEETGARVEVTGLVGIYTDTAHMMAYDDGEVRQELSVCFHARLVSGETARGRDGDEGGTVGRSGGAAGVVDPSDHAATN